MVRSPVENRIRRKAWATHSGTIWSARPTTLDPVGTSRVWPEAGSTTERKPMIDWTPYTARAREWFESLRDAICAEFEAIEREAGSAA